MLSLSKGVAGHPEDAKQLQRPPLHPLPSQSDVVWGHSFGGTLFNKLTHHNKLFHTLGKHPAEDEIRTIATCSEKSRVRIMGSCRLSSLLPLMAAHGWNPLSY